MYETGKSVMEQQIDYKNSVVFNAGDAALCNGYITHVTIEFSQIPEVLNNGEKSHKVTLYVISQTVENDSFQIVQRYDIPPKDIKSNRGKRTFNLPDSIVYLEQDQLLAIGFGPKSGTPKCINNGTHYALDLVIVNTAYENNKSAKFNKSDSHIAINFHFVPTLGKFI
jgi:hypothetical protein